MQKLTKQQIRIFGMFALAFLLSGVATAYSQVGLNFLALPAAAVAFGLIGQMVHETYRS